MPLQFADRLNNVETSAIRELFKLLGKPQGLRWVGLVPGLVLTLLGLVLMTQATRGAADVGQLATHYPHFWRGIGWAVASMLSWTAFGLLNAAWLKRHGASTAAAIAQIRATRSPRAIETQLQEAFLEALP